MLNPIVYAVPLFFLLLIFELLAGWILHRNTYRLGDSLSSISLGLAAQVLNVFTKVFLVGVYALVYEHLAFTHLPADRWWTWALAIVGYDFLYYWNHRMGHEVAGLWASHVVHHSSEEFNYATAMRQTSTSFLTSWLFFWPLALIGIPPQIFVAAAAISLLYQFWIHTRHIGSLGWFDRWFASPSNHRVHHGRNDYCLDRNYGAILMLWDHLFGSYEAERPASKEPIVYGAIDQLDSFSPLKANLCKYQHLLAEMRETPGWKDRLRLWLKPPGWHPAHRQALYPPLDNDLSKVRPFRPAISRLAASYGAVQSLVLLLIGGAFIGAPGQLDLATRVLAAAWILASLWVMSGTLEARPHHLRWQALWLPSLAMPVALASRLPTPWAGWTSLALAILAACLSLMLLGMNRQPSAAAST